MSVAAALTVVVHVSNLAGVPATVVRDAQADVTALFREVGVAVRWVDDVPHVGAHVEARLILLPRADGALRTRSTVVFGAASRTPGGLGTAWVFYRRVADHAERHALFASRLLACAIAHELGHVLQRAPGHSDSGLMRATWRAAEFRSAALGQLRFTSADAAAFTLPRSGDAIERRRGPDDQTVAVNRR